MLHDGRTLPPMPASWFRVMSDPKGLVRLLLLVPDTLPLVEAIRLSPLHVGLTIVRPDNFDEALSLGSYDVIVSDQIDVLLRAQKHMPTARRVWMVDSAAVSNAEWAYAHHILQWDANLSDLTAVLDSSLDGNGVPNLRLPKDASGELPKMPSDALHLFDILDDPNATTAKIRAAMQLDPIMVGKVLGVVNSPYFNLPRRVASLDRAIVLLGINKLRAAVLAGVCFGAIEGLDKRHVSRISQRGLKAMLLVRQMAGCHAESAVTAAILMDIGQLLMMKTDPDYPKLVEICLKSGASLIDTEHAHYGFTHAYLGARLLHHWGLPRDVIQAVAYSHTGYPLPSRPHSPRMLLFIASELIEASEAGRPVHFHPAWLEQTGWADSIEEWQHYLADADMLAIAS
ncbi:MAG: HD-like signal output (HDOD) protein [Myxococcota bacterium]